MHGSNKVHFRMKWVGEPGTPKQGQIGLLNLTPEKPFWELTLPSGALDNFRFTDRDRRQSVRVKCSISVELHPAGQSVIWGRASDLSVGGCFVEMPIPLEVDSSFEIVLWLGETKLRLKGEVVSKSSGFGVGMRFVNTSQMDQELLERHIASIVCLNCSTSTHSMSFSAEHLSATLFVIVQNALYRSWGKRVGAVEIGALLSTSVVAFLARGRGAIFALSMAGAGSMSHVGEKTFHLTIKPNCAPLLMPPVVPVIMIV